MKRILVVALLIFCASSLQAHPVSYKGGSQFETFLNTDWQTLNLYHSFAWDQAIGVRYIHFNEDENYHIERHINLLQYNHLVKRWNGKDYQGNFYLMGGAGAAYGNFNDTEPVMSVGLQGDWENRRIYTAYKNQLLYSDEFTHFTNEGRIGFAPYEGDYEDLNTWILLQVRHTTEFSEDVEIMPMLRFFYENYLWEVGASIEGKVQVNFMIHF